MSESTTVTPTLCRRCGQTAPVVSGTCQYCGSPLAAATGIAAQQPASSPATSPASAPATSPASAPAQSGQLPPAQSGQLPPAQSGQLPPTGWAGPPTVPTATAGVPYRFEPARIRSGPRLSRKGWLAIGVSGAVVVLAVAAFLVFRPEPPSPAGTVEDYFAALSSGDTAAALALVGVEGDFSPESTPLLVPEALGDAANRPTDATVTSTQIQSEGEGEFTMVTVTYKIGGQPLGQVFPVVATGNDEMPYLLAQPFVYLTVQAPNGLSATVNGIAVDADTLSRGTPAFQGAYKATTTGNALFAGTTQAATYQAADGGVTARIQFGQPELAPDAPRAVQAATEEVLDTNCVNPTLASYNYQCPLRAPYKSYRQITTWKITTNPQIQLSPASRGQTSVPFTTGTPGAAEYTITYTDFGGTTQTESGSVPIEITGYAAIGDDGAIRVALN